MDRMSSSVEQKYFEDFSIGETVTLTRKFTRSDVNVHGDLLGDYNPIHYDESFAKEMGFKGCLVPGIMTEGLAARLAGMKLPGAGAIFSDDTFSFKKPVYIGDEVTVRATIKELYRGGRLGRVVLDIVAFVKEETVMTGKITCCVQYRKAAA
ncbi:MAG: MaoC family dehydratase [bacterium]|nr:MaoC family dehydratase [bacterium]